MDFDALLDRDNMKLPEVQRAFLRRAVAGAYHDAARAHPARPGLYRDLPPEMKWKDLSNEAQRAVGRGLLELLETCAEVYSSWSGRVVDAFMDVEKDKFKMENVEPSFERPFGALARTKVSDGLHELRDGTLVWDTDPYGGGPYGDVALSSIKEVCSFLHAMGKTREVEALFDVHVPKGVFRTKKTDESRLDTLADYTK